MVDLNPGDPTQPHLRPKPSRFDVDNDDPIEICCPHGANVLGVIRRASVVSALACPIAMSQNSSTNATVPPKAEGGVTWLGLECLIHRLPGSGSRTSQLK
ncbi:MAG: hypothetical protein ACI83Y_002107 [Candidatus Azotimanducaceae bacterium]